MLYLPEPFDFQVKTGRVFSNQCTKGKPSGPNRQFRFLAFELYGRTRPVAAHFLALPSHEKIPRAIFPMHSITTVGGWEN
jgi:hypothetical protein